MAANARISGGVLLVELGIVALWAWRASRPAPIVAELRARGLRPEVTTHDDEHQHALWIEVPIEDAECAATVEGALPELVPARTARLPRGWNDGSTGGWPAAPGGELLTWVRSSRDGRVTELARCGEGLLVVQRVERR